MYTFGNGGSATDAAETAEMFSHSDRVGRPCRRGRWWTIEAVLTALANDVGFDVVYSRQLIAHGRAGDVAVGLSTSGNSANVIAAFERPPAAGS